MGLIAREIEARGIPTLCFSSALSITQAVKPPRAVYLDYPLGHTTGKPEDPDNQRDIMQAALMAFENISSSGEIVPLEFSWQADDSWKDKVMRPRQAGAQNHPSEHQDDRVERWPTPQYQNEADAQAADPACPTCIFPESAP